MISKVRVFFLFFLLYSSCAFAQSRVKLDSLQLQLANAKEDTLKITTLLQISDFYFNSQYDSAVEFAKQAKELAQKRGLKRFEANANNYIAGIFIATGDYKNS